MGTVAMLVCKLLLDLLSELHGKEFCYFRSKPQVRHFLIEACLSH